MAVDEVERRVGGRWVVGAGFEQQDRAARVLARPRGDDRASAARPNDHQIEEFVTEN